MAINHVAVWTKAGKLLKKANSLKTLNDTTLPADLQEIVAAYGTASTGTTTGQSPIEGLHQAYVGLMQTVTAMRVQLLSYIDSTFQDYDTIVDEMSGYGVSAVDLPTILYWLIEDMLEQNQSVERSTVTVGAVSAASRNVGNGTVVVDSTLDGFNPPVVGGIAHPRYKGVTTEMVPTSATLAWICLSDSYGTTGTDGAESFSWGDGVDFGEASGFPEGAGDGPGMTAGDGYGIISNGAFEDFTDDLPSGWDLFAGSAGTSVQEETGIVYRGDSALRLTGDGGISQDFSGVDPLRRYLVAVRVYKDGAPSAGYFDVHIEGTDYTTATGPESIRALASSYSAQWNLAYFWWTAPADCPADLTLVVRTEDVTGGDLIVDSLTFAPAAYHAGVASAVVPGSKPFARGDRFTCAISNGSEKVIQKFARTHWKIQLPSTAGGTGGYFIHAPYLLFSSGSSAATIADSLAT